MYGYFYNNYYNLIKIIFFCYCSKEKLYKGLNERAKKRRGKKGEEEKRERREEIKKKLYRPKSLFIRSVFCYFPRLTRLNFTCVEFIIRIM